MVRTAEALLTVLINVLRIGPELPPQDKPHIEAIRNLLYGLCASVLAPVLAQILAFSSRLILSLHCRLASSPTYRYPGLITCQRSLIRGQLPTDQFAINAAAI